MAVRITPLWVRPRWRCSRVIEELIGQLAGALQSDAAEIDPARGVYSPQGITYGFSAEILSNMAIDMLVSQPSLGLSLEDMFRSRGRLDDALARAVGWVRLPRRVGEREHFDHSAQHAAESQARLTRALETRAHGGRAPNASTVRAGRLVVVPAPASPRDVSAPGPADSVPAGEYFVTTDVQRAVSGGATALTKDQLLLDRKEGRYLASAEIDGHWVGISKVILTRIIGQGQDALMADVPANGDRDGATREPRPRGARHDRLIYLFR